MSNVTITENEYQLMDQIAHDLYSETNGQTPTEYWHCGNPWTDVPDWSLNLGWKQAFTKGVMSSLSKKELVVFQGDSNCKPRDVMDAGEDPANCYITEKGFEVWKAEHHKRNR